MARKPSASHEEIAVRDVQAVQRRVLFRRGQRFDFQHDFVRRIRDAQQAAFDAVVALAERLAVHAQRHQFDVLAVQLDRGAGAVAIAPHRHPVGDDGAGGVEVEAQFHRLHQVARRRVIVPVNRLGSVCAHRKWERTIGRRSILPIPPGGCPVQFHASLCNVR
jgi:hypothetical protein